MKPEYDLVLRTCKYNMASRNGFKWPKKGAVKAPDWDPKPECGYGLHGLLHGCGDAGLLSKSPKAKWLVVKVLKGTCIDLGDKVKFPKGTVVYAGTREEAVKIIAEAYPEAPVVFANRCSVDYGFSTSGDYGASTSGDYGTSTSGWYGTSTSGWCGTSISGYRGTSAAGIGGTLIIKWYDSSRSRTAVAYVGENGIKPNVAYRLDNKGKFIKA